MGALAAAARDAALATAFLRVTALVERPQSLTRPEVVLRVLRKAPWRDRPRSPGAWAEGPVASGGRVP